MSLRIEPLENPKFRFSFKQGDSADVSNASVNNTKFVPSKSEKKGKIKKRNDGKSC